MREVTRTNDELSPSTESSGGYTDVPPRHSDGSGWGTRTQDRNTWGCPPCGGRFTGSLTCHCALCHVTFSSPSTFDAHQPGKCITPQDMAKLTHAKGTVNAGKPKFLIERRTGQGFDYEVVACASYTPHYRTRGEE